MRLQLPCNDPRFFAGEGPSGSGACLRFSLPFWYGDNLQKQCIPQHCFLLFSSTSYDACATYCTTLALCSVCVSSCDTHVYDTLHVYVLTHSSFYFVNTERAQEIVSSLFTHILPMSHNTIRFYNSTLAYTSTERSRRMREFRHTFRTRVSRRRAKQAMQSLLSRLPTA